MAYLAVKPFIGHAPFEYFPKVNLQGASGKSYEAESKKNGAKYADGLEEQSRRQNHMG
jgi:hypothetical protein